MRPHWLQVTAFGAFARTATVSFDDLEGLFLLHGETGAGKTTLLDAIAFALYGRVPGERGKARRLRSDHAAPDVRTEVVLEATIGARRLRITRSPEQERPKRHGTGLTTERPRVLLEESLSPGEWRATSTRAGEADAEIADLMGMSAEQFFQVVLLPQGQFAQFLQADADARAKLLQKLFGTDRFRAVEDWLAERRRCVTAEVAAAADELDRLVARVAQAAGVSVPEDPPAPVPESPPGGPESPPGGPESPPGGPESPPGGPWQARWAAALAHTAVMAQDAASALAAKQAADLDAALAAQRDIEQLADRQRRRAEAVRRRERIVAAAEEMELLRTELDAANRAAEAAPVLAEATRAGEVAAAARRAEQAARGALPDELRALGADELRSAAREQGERLGLLDGLRDVARQSAAEERAAATARERATTLAGQLAATTREAGLRRERRPEAMAARDAAQRAAGELAAARTEAARFRAAATDCAALLRARADHDRLDRAHLATEKTAVELRREELRIRAARIDGMRAELASVLVDGTPCPVCGSLDHPELCELTGEPVSREQEDAARLAADAAHEGADKAGQRVAAATALIGELTQRLADAGFAPAAEAARLEVSTARLEAEAARLEAEAARLEAAADRIATCAAALGDLQARLDELDAEIAAAERSAVELSEQHAAAQSEAEAAAQRAAAARESLRAQLGGARDLDAAIAGARQGADALSAGANAADETARAQADARRTDEAAVQAAVTAGFAGPAALDAARAAQRDQRWRREADERIRQYESDSKAVAERLADPELDVALEPAAPVAGAVAAVASARAAHDVAVADGSRAQHRAQQLAVLVPRVDERLTALEPLQARAAEARRLADLAAGLGANSLRMTLSSFVLAARLEEVAEAASKRLLKMTAGRYSLVHTDARRGGGRAGLGLLACDSWTGADRDTATLSGGETFLASLSLALGLADVVTAEAAGAPMEALFVDEGFGSLDEDTLDEVMNVLDGLREGGRIVGIVSHVAELRQRIPAQVHVRKGQHGSLVAVLAG